MSALFCRCCLLAYALSYAEALAGYPLKIVIIRRKMVSSRRAPPVALRAFNFPSLQVLRPTYDNSRKGISHFRSLYIKSTPKEHLTWRQEQILKYWRQLLMSRKGLLILGFSTSTYRKQLGEGSSSFLTHLVSREMNRKGQSFHLIHWIRTCMWGIVQRSRIPSISSMLSVHRCLLNTVGK